MAHCVLSSREWILKMARELASRYPDCDAAWVDSSTSYLGWVNEPWRNVSVSPLCQAMYLEEFGVPMPIIERAEDERMEVISSWMTKKISLLLEEVSTILSRDRQLPIVGNIAYGAGNAYQHPPILNNLDGGLFEFAFDQVDLIRKVSEARSILPVSIHYPDSYDPWPRRVSSGWEVEAKGLTILGLGGTPYLAQPGKYYYDSSNDEPARRVFSLMEQHKDIFKGQESEFFAQILAPHVNTASDLQERIGRSTRGWISAFSDIHYTVGVYPSFLLPYKRPTGKVLIMPSAPMASENEWASLLEWVGEGGNLILPWDMPKVDSLRETMAGDLLGINWSSKDSMPLESLNRRYSFERDCLGGQTYDLSPQWNEAAVSASKFPVDSGAFHFASIGLSRPLSQEWELLAEVVASDHPEPYWPLIATRSLGKGRILWSAADFGLNFGDHRHSTSANWIKSVMQWLVPDAPAVTIEGSRQLQMFATALGKDRLIYLVNQSNDFQPFRQHWHQPFQYADQPLPLGRVSIRIVGSSKIDLVYGSAPDMINNSSEGLHCEYENFHNHTILRAIG